MTPTAGRRIRLPLGERRRLRRRHRRAEHDDVLVRVALRCCSSSRSTARTVTRSRDGLPEHVGEHRVLLDDGGHRAPPKTSGMMSRAVTPAVVDRLGLVGPEREGEVAVAGGVDDPLGLLLVDREREDRPRDLLGGLLPVVLVVVRDETDVSPTPIDLHLRAAACGCTARASGWCRRAGRPRGRRRRRPATSRPRVHEAGDPGRVGELDADGQLVVGDRQRLLRPPGRRTAARSPARPGRSCRGRPAPSIDGGRAQRAVDHVLADHLASSRTCRRRARRRRTRPARSSWWRSGPRPAPGLRSPGRRCPGRTG